MKKVLSVFLLVITLCGCSKESAYLDRVVSLRNKLSGANGCCFISEIGLDYGDSTYSFSVMCSLDTENTMNLTVIDPEPIAGICARITGESGHLTFDEKFLAFEMIADGNIAPICIPWLFICSLRSGYISSFGSGTDGYFAVVEDTYKGADYLTEITFNNLREPVFAEIIWQGKRIASMTVSEFKIL